MSYKLFSGNRFLCLSPHPDDIEYSVAGTIMKYKDSVFDIICMSQGSAGDKSSGPARLEEVKNFWQGVENVNLYLSPKPFIGDRSEEEWINFICDEFIQAHNYHSILVPSSDDSHFEHRFVSGLSYALTRWSNIGVILYFSPSTLNSLYPNLFVDISPLYEEKIKRLKSFMSQLNRKYFSDEILTAFHNNFQCAKKSLPFIEKYIVSELFL
jgi:LmbE family N-acetylglucosaminyl deacetylase